MTWEIVCLGAIIAFIFFKINHPEITGGCLIGMHKWYYAYEKHGMHQENGKIVGTQRKIYKCRCGVQKRAEDKDWIQ